MPAAILQPKGAANDSTGRFLVFVSGDFIKDESHLMQCIELLGPLPLETVIQKGERARDWFDLETGAFKTGTPPAPHPDVIETILAGTFEVDPEGAAEVADFVRAALVYDPTHRPTAEDLLAHNFSPRRPDV